MTKEERKTIYQCERCGTQLSNSNCYCYNCGGQAKEVFHETPAFTPSGRSSYAEKLDENKQNWIIAVMLAFIAPFISIALPIPFFVCKRDGRGWDIFKKMLIVDFIFALVMVAYFLIFVN